MKKEFGVVNCKTCASLEYLDKEDIFICGEDKNIIDSWIVILGNLDKLKCPKCYKIALKFSEVKGLLISCDNTLSNVKEYYNTPGPNINVNCQCCGKELTTSIECITKTHLCINCLDIVNKLLVSRNQTLWQKIKKLLGRGE